MNYAEEDYLHLSGLQHFCGLPKTMGITYDVNTETAEGNVVFVRLQNSVSILGNESKILYLNA